MHSFQKSQDSVCCGFMNIREMQKEDWSDVARIFAEGIATKVATFQRTVPSQQQWDTHYIRSCRLVAHTDDGHIIGWAALSPVSSRAAYRGVAEVSIYVAADYRSRSVGSRLLKQLIACSEEAGYWTLQAVIIVENHASIALHRHCGFRVVGKRERIGLLEHGSWSDTLLLERRSLTVGTTP